MEGSQMTQYDQSLERPGCVTAYAILAFVGAGIYIIGGMIFGFSGLTDPEFAGFSLFIALCMGIFAIIPIVMGIGLWKMAKWGWWIVIITTILGIGIGLLNILSSFLLLASESSGAFGTLCGSILGLAINGYIFYWFFQNRSLFDGPPVYEKVVGPDGEIIEKPVSKSSVDGMTIIIIVGVFGFLCLMPVVLIAVLTLLGPQIGDVFSRITAELGTPMP